MLVIFLKGIAVDQDVIQVDNIEAIKVAEQDFVYIPLPGRWPTSQPKGHNLILVGAEVSFERSGFPATFYHA